jgi:hypothetical protein
MTLSVDTIIAIIIALLGIMCQYFISMMAIQQKMAVASLDNEKAHSKLKEEVCALITAEGLKIKRAETQMELFWNAVGGAVSDLIKQPIHFRKDELMDKLFPVNGRISEVSIMPTEELFELKTILQSEISDLKKNKDSKSLAHALALAYIDQTLLHRGVIGGLRQ